MAVAAHRILKRLGGGRYADVFLAEHDGREVVLKVALDEPRDEPYVTNAIFFARGQAFHTGSVGEWTPDPRIVLSREAALLSRVSHPAMVKLLDHGEGWLALERIDGPTFREGFTRMDAAAVQELARLLDEMSSELPLHGDIKPENVMWDGRGAIRILDPAAGAMESIGPQPIKMLATPAYNPLLLPSDRPALGIMLLEALMKSHPLLHAHPVPLPGRWNAPTRERLDIGTMLGRSEGASLLDRILLPSDLDASEPSDLEELALGWLGLGRSRTNS